MVSFITLKADIIIILLAYMYESKSSFVSYLVCFYYFRRCVCGGRESRERGIDFACALTRHADGKKVEAMFRRCYKEIIIIIIFVDLRVF